MAEKSLVQELLEAEVLRLRELLEAQRVEACRVAEHRNSHEQALWRQIEELKARVENG
jgi:hypothetical protein